MKIAALLLIALMEFGFGLCAQEIKLPAGLDKLAAKADDTVDITLDGNLLRLAAKFLSDKDPDEARAKKAISGLQSVTVRSFEFSRDGQYDPSEVNAVRAQLQSPTWSRIVGAKSKATGEDLDVYFKIDAQGNLGGVFLISAGPRELTIIQLAGTIDPEHLADLGGQFHIPEMDFHFRRGGDAR